MCLGETRLSRCDQGHEPRGVANGVEVPIDLDEG